MVLAPTPAVKPQPGAVVQKDLKTQLGEAVHAFAMADNEEAKKAARTELDNIQGNLALEGMGKVDKYIGSLLAQQNIQLTSVRAQNLVEEMKKAVKPGASEVQVNGQQIKLSPELQEAVQNARLWQQYGEVAGLQQQVNRANPPNIQDQAKLAQKGLGLAEEQMKAIGQMKFDPMKGDLFSFDKMKRDRMNTANANVEAWKAYGNAVVLQEQITHCSPGQKAELGEQLEQQRLIVDINRGICAKALVNTKGQKNEIQYQVNGKRPALDEVSKQLYGQSYKPGIDTYSLVQEYIMSLA